MDLPKRSLPITLGVAVAVALVSCGGDEAAQLSSSKPAPSASDDKTGTTERIKKEREHAPPGEDPVAFDLKRARHFRDQQDEAEALRYLDGKDPQIVLARQELLEHCQQILKSGREQAIELAMQGRRDEARGAIAALRRRLPGQFQDQLDLAAQEVRVVSPRPSGDPDKLEFERRLAALGKNASADAHYALGKWAGERKLLAEARQCFRSAVRLDGFHEGARTALGHKRHKGRWYTPQEYELALKREREQPKVTPKAKVIPKDGPPPPPFKEDTAWYKDNYAICAWADAPTYESKYYKIRTNVRKKYAKRYGKMMDQYFKRFIKVFKAFLPDQQYTKSEIWIHSSQAEFRKENPQMPPTAGGYYSPKTKRVHAFHGLFGKTGTTRTVMAHEGTHQFEDIVLRGKFWNAPIWIIEGLAVFFESAYYVGGDVKIGLVPRDRLWALKRGLKANKLIPLNTLIRTPQRQFRGYHYAHAWALIYMVLYYGKSPKTRRRCQAWFSELFAAALKGPVRPKDVIKRIGGRKAFDELEAEWKAWIKDLPYDYKPKKR